MVDYNASSIEIKTPLEHIRSKIGMYLGSSDVRGLNHGAYEVIDNAVDEVMSESSNANLIKVAINEDGSFTVEDNGRGIPVDMHETGRPAVELIFLSMNTGGKFNSDAYKTSGGTHGVGLKAVTATSKWLEVEVKRGGNVYLLRIEDQKVSDELKVIGKCERSETGTKVTYMPDDEVFSTVTFNRDKIKERLKQAAYLNKGLKVIFEDNQLEDREEYIYEEGMVEYLEEIAKNYGMLTDIQKVEAEDESTGMKADIAYVWVDNYSKQQILTFTNSIRHTGGGTSETGFKSAVTRTLNNFSMSENITKVKLDGEDLRSGLFAIINVLIPENLLELEGQTKNRLGTKEARVFIDDAMSNSVNYLIHNNGDFGRYIINKALESHKLRERLRKERNNKTRSKKSKNRISSDKLLEPTNIKKGKDNMELFICEGDSAGGNVKQARDRKTQGVLPIRGKILNVFKSTIDKVHSNVEIQTILEALGTGMGENFRIEDLRYDKVIILTDADVDGAHIQVLLLGLFYKHFRPLIENGHVYVARPPLYVMDVGADESYYYWDKVKAREDYPNGELSRFKGLGEQPKESLAETALHPDTRLIDRVVIEDALNASILLEQLLGSDAELRKEWVKGIKFG